MARSLASIAACQRPRRMSMCEGMCTMWPRAGCRSRSRSAAASAFSGCGDASHSVDVQVVGERVLRIELHHRLEGFQDLRRFRLRLAVDRPQIPGAEVHERFRVQAPMSASFGNFSHAAFIALAYASSSGRVSLGRGSAYRAASASIECAIGFRLGLRLRASRLQRLPGGLRLFRREEGVVVVLAQAERDSPVGHRAIGIEFRGPSKRTDRLIVIERVHEVQPLVEEPLRLGVRCRHRPRVLAEALVQGDLGVSPGSRAWRFGRQAAGNVRQRRALPRMSE